MAAAVNDSFLILGHGEEEIVEFGERPVLPAGYTLVTIEECGIVTTEENVCPLVEAFSQEVNRAIFQDPRANKATIERFMRGKGIHIYNAGNRYPRLSIQFFLDWPTPTHTKISKTGTYRFPLDGAAFQVGPGGTFQERMFKLIGPYTGYMDDLPADFNAREMFDGSIVPTLERVEEVYAATRSSSQIKKALTIPLETVFETGGPGVYYYVVCRSPRLALSPRQLVDVVLFEGKNREPYEPFFTHNWISKIPEILPILEENSARHKYWIKAEIDGAIRDYSHFMQRVPLIRQASINQQAAAAAAAPVAAAAAAPVAEAAAAGNARRRKSRKTRKARKASRRRRSE